MNSVEDLRSSGALRHGAQMPLLLDTLSDSSFDSKKQFTYTAAMFCDTSRSGEEANDGKVLSGNSNLFQELDQLHR